MLNTLINKLVTNDNYQILTAALTIHLINLNL